MNIVVAALGSAGDVHPFLGIAGELKKRGHQVTVLTSSYFEQLVVRAGLRFSAIGSRAQYQRVMNSPDMWRPGKGFAVFVQHMIAPAMRPTYEFIRAHCARGDSAVIASTWCVGARLAQEALAIPTVTAHLAPSTLRTVYRPPEFAGLRMSARWPHWLQRAIWRLVDRWHIDPVLAAPLNAFRRELGLADVRRVLRAWIHSPSGVIALFPDWFAPPQPDWPPHTAAVGFPLFDERELHAPNADLEAFLQDGPPPLVFTPGTAMLQGAHFFEVSMRACVHIGVRAVFLTQFPAQLPAELPPHIRHVHYEPLSRLLPRAAAIVHHGGIGTCAQASRAGVPQLAVPMGHDQYDNAARLQALGIGRRLDARRYSVPSLVAALEHLQGSAMRERCRQVAGLFAGHAPLTRVCEFIEQVARGGVASGS